MNRKSLFASLLMIGSCLPLTAHSAAAKHLPHEPFVSTLDSMLRNERLISYHINALTSEQIDVELTYSGDHRYSDQELEPFNNGVCYALLKQAVEVGLMPFTGNTRISCRAIQQQGERSEAGSLGVSRYQRHSDDFIYTSTRSAAPS